jgi:hypothetical protein
MAVLALLEDIENCAFRKERVSRDRNDIFAHDDSWLINCYPLPINVLLDLCIDLAPNLERKTCCNHAIPVSVQVLSTLGFLPTGTLQREMSHGSGTSQPSFSRILPQVTQVIEAILHTPRATFVSH